MVYPVPSPVECLDWHLKPKQFVTMQGVGGNGVSHYILCRKIMFDIHCFVYNYCPLQQVPERGLEIDKSYEVLPYPLEVTDRDESGIRALMRIAVLKNTSWVSTCVHVAYFIFAIYIYIYNTAAKKFVSNDRSRHRV